MLKIKIPLVLSVQGLNAKFSSDKVFYQCLIRNFITKHMCNSELSLHYKEKMVLR